MIIKISQEWRGWLGTLFTLPLLNIHVSIDEVYIVKKKNKDEML